jgi:arylsulfatase A-like enzyme
MQLVHDQWTAPDRFLERCSYPNDSMSDYVQDVEYQYCGMNLMLDEAIANLTCAMETYGFVDNTIMIVVSDNGGESTIQGNNYPFRGSKGSTYRGGVTVQGFIHSKLISDNMKGQSYHGIVHITDWLPTIMGLATNYEWTGSLVDATIDGVDMWETIMNNGTSTHVEIAHYANGEGAASIQYNHYKLELGTTPSGAGIVSWVFEEDLKPENSDLSCENVSLMDCVALGSIGCIN